MDPPPRRVFKYFFFKLRKEKEIPFPHYSDLTAANGHLLSSFQHWSQNAQDLLQHNYVVAGIEQRDKLGTGHSLLSQSHLRVEDRTWLRA